MRNRFGKRRYGRSLTPGMWYIEHRVNGHMVDRWGPFRTQNEAYAFRDKIMAHRLHPIKGDIITLPMIKR